MMCRSRLVSSVVACFAGAGIVLSAAQRPAPRKPDLSLNVRPLLGFTPAKFTLTAELRGGDDDYEEFYCAAVEWDWDDGTRSEASSDCDPYRSGRSRIRRHFVAQHIYDTPDTYRVTFRLKKKDKVVAAASKEIDVQPGR